MLFFFSSPHAAYILINVISNTRAPTHLQRQRGLQPTPTRRWCPPPSYTNMIFVNNPHTHKKPSECGRNNCVLDARMSPTMGRMRYSSIALRTVFVHTSYNQSPTNETRTQECEHDCIQLQCVGPQSANTDKTEL